MGITSLTYIVFLISVIVIYYCIPSRIRWVGLLAGGFAYMAMADEWLLIIYPVISVFVAWLCTNKMEAVRQKNKDDNEIENADKKLKILLVMALAGSLGVLVILRYLNLGVYTWNACAMILTGKAGGLEVLHWMAPVGLSFYTMSLMGYIFDVYYEIGSAQKNYFKLLLFGTYFPLLVSGPIVRYKDLGKELTTGHGLSYDNITYGATRMLWGFFKSLVISERLAVVVAKVFDDYNLYSGGYVLLGMICFTLQLYTNFSGSMDIIMGASEMFGIKLPENFRQPFFSETIQEFWQRWHITLGAWLKDYILYPVLRTKPFMEMPKKLKDKCGKKKAKQYTTFLALIILWFISGLWHGGAWKYIFGTGLLQCAYIIVSELTQPFFEKFNGKCHINSKSAWFRLFRRIRTFLLITVGFMFFNASSLRTGMAIFKQLFCIKGMQGIDSLGIEPRDWAVLAVALIILWAVSYIQQKGSVRAGLFELGIVPRWCILFALILIVVVLGNYGPGYDAAEFIYQGF